jgi:hypothetical protein
MCLEHYKDHGEYTFGLDAEIKKKLDAKFDAQKASQAIAWLEALTGIRAHAGGGEVSPTTVQDYLKTGVVLCQAINTIKPGSVPNVNKAGMAFKERENIANYLSACTALGCRSTDSFMTQDLYDGGNLGVVVDNIHVLGALSRKVTTFHGPYIGVKLADENRRQFTEEQLKQPSVSRQTQGSYGYQDETYTPSIGRQIIKDTSGYKASDVASKQNMGSYGVQVERGPTLDKIIKNPDMLEANRGGAVAAAAAVAAAQSSDPKKDKKFCGGCGKARDTSAQKFCGECGAKFD